MSAVLSREQIQNFFHSVTHGQSAETEALLIATPETTQELLRIAGPLTDNSGRTFNCTAYEYAHWAKDVEMCRMLESHMDDETCSQIYSCIAVNDVKGLVYKQNDKEHHRESFDFNPLIAALDNLDKKTRYIKKSEQEYETSLNKLEQKQRDVKKAEDAREQARIHAEEIKRHAAAAREEVKKAQQDVNKTQGDVNKEERKARKAQDNAELALSKIGKAQDNVEMERRNAEQANHNVELAQLNREQAPRNAEQAQHEVKQAWCDVPAYISRDYGQWELRNIAEKNANQLKELRHKLNRKERLLIDSILQSIPEYSLLYDPINNLKQKTMSLPSDIRDSIYIELGFLMKNINNHGMDNSDLISRFEENCCSKFDMRDSFYKELRFFMDFHIYHEHKETIAKRMGDYLTPEEIEMQYMPDYIIFAGVVIGVFINLLIGALAFIFLPPAGMIFTGLGLSLLCLTLGFPVSMALGALPGLLLGAVPRLVTFTLKAFKDASIKNALHDITELVSNPVIQLSNHQESVDFTTPDISPTGLMNITEQKPNHAGLRFFSGTHSMKGDAPDDIAEYSSRPESESSDDGLTPGLG